MINTTALVLIDLQTAAFDGVGVVPIHDADRLVRNAQALLHMARASGVPVVHIQHCAPAGELFAQGARGWPIFPPLAPAGSEPVVRKHGADAFEGTDLHGMLQAIGASTLVVAGLQTEHCVSATCRGALGLGYAVHLAQEAHSTWPGQIRSAVEIMAEESTALASAGVNLRTTEDLLALLRSPRS